MTDDSSSMATVRPLSSSSSSARGSRGRRARTDSMAKKTPLMGALKPAATPAALPDAMSEV